MEVRPARMAVQYNRTGSLKRRARIVEESDC